MSNSTSCGLIYMLKLQSAYNEGFELCRKHAFRSPMSEHIKVDGHGSTHRDTLPLWEAQEPLGVSQCQNDFAKVEYKHFRSRP